MKKPSIAQKMLLAHLASQADGTAAFGGREISTIRACARRRLVEFVGLSPMGWRRYRITDAGREALREVTD